MLQAIRKHYRVVMLSLIGDYRNWAPIGSRQKELVEGSIALANILWCGGAIPETSSLTFSR